MGRKRLHHEGDICETDGCYNHVAQSGSHRGVPRYKGVCSTCHRMRYSRPWLAFRKKACEACGYKPIFARSLHVHHRDGDKKNNESFNLTTLCSNCHGELEGLITELSGDWETAESLLKKFVRTLFE